MSGNSGQQAQHKTTALNAQAAREIHRAQEQARAQLRELQEQARYLAQAQTPKAPQPLTVAQCATPDGGDVNAFLKEALTTALQGNEDLRVMEAATRIDEIVAERNYYFTNARDLKKHFREMQQKYKAPQEINLASLAALNDSLHGKFQDPGA